MPFPARLRDVRPAAAQSGVRPGLGPRARCSVPRLSRTTPSAHAPTSRIHEAHDRRAAPRVLSTSRDHAQDARRRTVPDVCAAASETRVRTVRPPRPRSRRCSSSAPTPALHPGVTRPYLVLWVSMVWNSSCSSSPLRTPSAKYALNSSKDNFPSSEMVKVNRSRSFKLVYGFIFNCLCSFICVCRHAYSKSKNNSRC